VPNYYPNKCSTEGKKKRKEIKTDHQHKNITQSSEVQRPITEKEMKIQCSITKMIYIRGDLQFHKFQTEIEHLKREAQKCNMLQMIYVPTKIL